MTTSKKRKGKRAGAPKGKGRPKAHKCTSRCHHTCGEAGGVTKKGKPCTRMGGTGRSDVNYGHLVMCRTHDPKAIEEWAASEYAMFDGLNGKQARFVLEYCGRANANATRAAELAGYGGPNATRGSLQNQGSVLLNNPKVKAAVLKRYDDLSAPGEEIMKRITADARMDIGPLVEVVTETAVVLGKNGEPDTPAVQGGVYLTLTAEVLAEYGTLIKEIETDPDTGRVVRIKLNDSQAARRDLAKIRRLFTDGPTINVFQLQDLTDEELTQRLEATRARLRGPGAGRHQPDEALSGGNGRK